MSEQTESIAKLAMALSKAQAKILGAVKDSQNPYFKSNYADLASVIDAIRLPLADNELAYIQTTDTEEAGVTVVTTLAHSSGEWIRGRLTMKPKDLSPQGYGSAITYARRYALASIVGVAQVDDDGNAASQHTGGIDPRGDAKANEADVNAWCNSIADLLAAKPEDLAEQIYKMHADLAQDNDLYICVGDALVSRGIISKAKWKELVKAGKPHGV